MDVVLLREFDAHNQRITQAMLWVNINETNDDGLCVQVWSYKFNHKLIGVVARTHLKNNPYFRSCLFVAFIAGQSKGIVPYITFFDIFKGPVCVDTVSVIQNHDGPQKFAETIMAIPEENEVIHWDGVILPNALWQRPHKQEKYTRNGGFPISIGLSSLTTLFGNNV